MTGGDAPVTYYITPHGAGWRVLSRGFAWDFAQRAPAVDFANDMAEQFALAMGEPTHVCFRDDSGAFHELRGFEGALPWPPPPDASHPATVLPFVRKA